MISACGLKCKECQFYNNPCSGCYNVEGKTFWAKDYTPNGICQLYNCSILKNNYKNCGDCRELPCQMFQDLKDPNITEEKHIKMIDIRVKNLNKN